MCGTGQETLKCEIFGPLLYFQVDISSVNLTYCHEKQPANKYKQGNINRLFFAQNKNSNTTAVITDSLLHKEFSHFD